MRRRLQLANSHASGDPGNIPSDGLPPESTSFGFPLYLNITTLSYEDAYEVEYERQGDDISMALKEWLYDNIYDVENNKIYINGCLVSEIILEGFSDYVFYFHGDSIFDYAYLSRLDDTSSIWGIKYK